MRNKIKDALLESDIDRWHEPSVYKLADRILAIVMDGLPKRKPVFVSDDDADYGWNECLTDVIAKLESK